MAERIEEYAMIGDCETAALISHRGSIDWLCWPYFSSPACFAALLGTEEHGHWSIAPKNGKPGTRRYLEHTLVLETRFETEEGAVELLDFMPMRGGTCCDVVRIVRGVRGAVPMAMQLVLRFDYGRSVPWVTRTDDGEIRAIAGPDMVTLKTSVETRGENLKTLAEFTIREGDTVSFVLTWGLSYQDPPKPVDAEDALQETIRFWRDWAGRAKLNGEYAEAVERSLITLKALTFRQTGGIVASPTTSLPEWVRGPRNWDYRFCWLRDATFTLLALMNAGYFDEACAWRDWLLRATMGSPDQAQIMYGIRGERQLLEWEVDWLPGYEDSKPVRIGNAAAGQLQLDVYGEVADALLQGHLGGIPAPETSFALQRALTDHLATCWSLPDQGIWEVRGEPQHFTYSKVMVWVAFDRAIKTSERFGLQGEVNRWRALRQQIHDEICDRGYDVRLGSFTQAYGSKEVDASLLLMPLVGFLPWTDPRIRGTVEAIEKSLLVDGFVMRYRTERVDDGLPAGEGVFLACSFWMVSALRMLGRDDDAKKMFDRLLELRNDVGLLSEEYDPTARRQLGNFPQALSHIALINAAYEFMRVTSPSQQRSETNSAPDESPDAVRHLKNDS
jgi:GH15 family glucan-1,4-alpha-glucosidase